MFQDLAINMPTVGVENLGTIVSTPFSYSASNGSLQVIMQGYLVPTS